MSHLHLYCARTLDDQEQALCDLQMLYNYGLCFSVSLSQNDSSNLFKTHLYFPQSNSHFT